MAGTFSLNSNRDLDPLLDRIGDAHCVMLGEASHGTHEYYTWRTAITKRLIEEKGFRFLAVEGDWPDCYLLNRYIKGYDYQNKEPYDLLHAFHRWPTWMWANWEIDALLNWLKNHNTGKAAHEKVGFYGLDVYSLWESMTVMNRYLQQHDPHAAAIAARALACFEPYGEDVQEYARNQYDIALSCREEVVSLLTAIQRSAPLYDHDPEASLNMEQNAYVALNAEDYYVNMLSFDNNTWNIRDRHMMDTLLRLMQFYGDEAKAIIWEHNTHIGDASYTEMKSQGLFNIGQLAREEFGRHDVVLVGFGSYSGEVIAGMHWDAPMQVMEVPEARHGSLEQILHAQAEQNRLIIFRDEKEEWYKKTIPHRAIGVVYHPDRERHGNYVATVPAERYDAFIYLDETTALHPLHLHPDVKKIPDTYPFNV